MLAMESANNHPIVPGTLLQVARKSNPATCWVQVLLLKPYEKEGLSTPRYKAIVSDTQHYIHCMIVAPLAHSIADKIINVGDIVRLTSYQLNQSKGGMFLVLGDAATSEIVRGFDKLGDPVNVIEYLEKVEKEEQGSAVVPPVTVQPSIPATPATTTNPFHSNLHSSKVSNESAMKPSSSTANSMAGFMGVGEDPENLQTICNLSPYHNRWTIKVRIVNKSDIKKFANQKGEGKLFSCTCIDSTGEIRMTAFGDAVDKFYDLVQDGQVYCVSNASVKIAKRQFGVRNEYEIHLEPTSLIALSQQNVESIPSIRYSFSKISEIEYLEKDAGCDIIGIIKDKGELSNITTRTTNKTLTKRDIIVGDSSGCSVRVTIWGVQAENFNPPHENAIIAIKAARVGDYNGKNLSLNSSSVISFDPDIPAAHELRAWFDTRGHLESSKSISVSAGPGATSQRNNPDDRKTIAQIKDDHLGTGEKPDYFSIMATINYIKQDGAISYTACPTEGCNKKVNPHNGPNMWFCDKCNQVFDRCDHRYILSLQLADHTGQTWVNAFNETGAQLLGKTAEEMYYLKNSEDPAYGQTFKEAIFKQYVFRIRAKQENYQGENKLRCNIMTAVPVSSEDESRHLIDKIEKSLL